MQSCQAWRFFSPIFRKILFTVEEYQKTNYVFKTNCLLRKFSWTRRMRFWQHRRNFFRRECENFCPQTRNFFNETLVFRKSSVEKILCTSGMQFRRLWWKISEKVRKKWKIIINNFFHIVSLNTSFWTRTMQFCQAWLIFHQLSENFFRSRGALKNEICFRNKLFVKMFFLDRHKAVFTTLPIIFSTKARSKTENF